jgi:cytochrome P450
MTTANAGPARFDSTLGAWVLSTYADVTTALRDPRLSVAGAGIEEPVARSLRRSSVAHLSAHLAAADRLTAWRADMETSARELASTFPALERIVLVASLARPLSSELATNVTGAEAAEMTRLTGLARQIFMAAATATGPQSEPAILEATSELARSLPAEVPTIAVQAFVAITQTLPCLMASVWLELFRRLDLLRRLQAEPGILPAVVEELLRLSSAGRAVFRQASEDVVLEHVRIRAGDRVILMLAAANHDPDAFPDPAEADLSRTSPSHLAFGRGTHRCAGASIVRTAVETATRALLDTGNSFEQVGPVEWTGGFAIQAPASLYVVAGPFGGENG